MKVQDYQVVNGTSYHTETPKKVISWLETSREREQRIRIFYGDTETGRDWMEEYDTIGVIGRSTGSCKIPLLIKNSRSMGGGGILDHCIVRITTKDSSGKIKDVYAHPNYHLPTFEVTDDAYMDYPFAVLAGDKAHANFKTQEQAEKYVAFIRGERNSK